MSAFWDAPLSPDIRGLGRVAVYHEDPALREVAGRELRDRELRWLVAQAVAETIAAYHAAEARAKANTH